MILTWCCGYSKRYALLFEAVCGLYMITNNKAKDFQELCVTKFTAKCCCFQKCTHLNYFVKALNRCIHEQI